jgi:hypothetical protein
VRVLLVADDNLLLPAIAEISGWQPFIGARQITAFLHNIL